MIPTLGWVSLGCPKALVDSERLMSSLQALGYQFSPHYQEADLIVINTCAFIESAEMESLESISEAMNENGSVLVIGCLGEKRNKIESLHPKIKGVLGTRSYEAVLEAIIKILPPPSGFSSPLPSSRVRLTPKHYAYLKIAEGCNHRCSFCIIPKLRGNLKSESISHLVKEAQMLSDLGAKELILIAQDTFAYGLDLGKSPRLPALLKELSKLGLWLRLHYLYPYPQLESLIDYMNEGIILPYLDMPLQHASAPILQSMRRVQRGGNLMLLENIKKWRNLCPDLTIRSTFIVGFPGETEEHFEELCAFLEEAKLDRVGAFAYSPVEGANANELPGAVDEETKQDRLSFLMELQAPISKKRLLKKVGRSIPIILDEIKDGEGIGRTQGDAPEIDGCVCVKTLPINAQEGQIMNVKIQGVLGEHDLFGVPEKA